MQRRQKPVIRLALPHLTVSEEGGPEVLQSLLERQVAAVFQRSLQDLESASVVLKIWKLNFQYFIRFHYHLPLSNSP